MMTVNGFVSFGLGSVTRCACQGQQTGAKQIFIEYGSMASFVNALTVPLAALFGVSSRAK
jgi:hypothetical protein